MTKPESDKLWQLITLVPLSVNKTWLTLTMLARCKPLPPCGAAAGAAACARPAKPGTSIVCRVARIMADGDSTLLLISLKQPVFHLFHPGHLLLIAFTVFFGKARGTPLIHWLNRRRGPNLSCDRWNFAGLVNYFKSA